MIDKIVFPLAAFTILASFCVKAVANDDYYKTPPKEAVDVLDIPQPPAASISPDGRWMVTTSFPAMPSISDRVAPMVRLGGVRINSSTNGPYDTRLSDLIYASYTGSGITYELLDLNDGKKSALSVPNEKLGPPLWSPDSSRFAFLHTVEDGVELWVVDAASGKTSRLTGPVINAARSVSFGSDAPCHWIDDNKKLLCHFVPSRRGEAPKLGVPKGPVMQETDGKEAPVRTYTNLLTNKHDEALYDFYMTSQPMIVNASSGRAKKIGDAAVYQKLMPSYGGEYFLSVRVVQPYSYLVPADRFPAKVEMLNSKGKSVRTLATLPMTSVGAGGAQDGPRDFAWAPGARAVLLYVEALDGGNPKQEADYRDSVRILEAPFTGEARELLRTKSRVVRENYYNPSNFTFTKDGAVLVKEFEWTTRDSQMWLVHWDTEENAENKVLWEHNKDDWYGNPGTPVLQSGSVVRQSGDWIYLAGEGGSADGDHPFLHRFNLSTGETERLLATTGDNYEQVIAVLDDNGDRVVTRYETSVDYPNYYLRNLKSGARTALTEIEQKPSVLTTAIKQQIDYVRDDGIPLSGTLYLPPDYKEGQRLPTIIWAYPREYASKDGAGQVRGSSHRYSGMSTSASKDYLLFLTQGYAVLANASMPIVGGPEANDTYVPQLVASAQATVDHLVEIGVTDRDRVGIAGHSYGAFMTMNLLAHSDIFASGIALSGAYNRTLTPFGFQNERRTFWEATDTYMAMSPFMHVTKINEPVLLVHGEIDSNTGTFPIQSTRMYHALKGLGATTRLVMLPYEDHVYVARESRLHVLAEEFAWFEKNVKNAKKD